MSVARSAGVIAFAKSKAEAQLKSDMRMTPEQMVWYAAVIATLKWVLYESNFPPLLTDEQIGCPTPTPEAASE
jgi:hypothetical protein